MIHEQPHPMAGKRVRIAATATHPQVPEFGGAELHLEDWWDRVSGGSWISANGNPACLVYAMRTAFSKTPVPSDNEVVYGHIGAFGHLVHVSEIEKGEPK